jgi:alkylation response protein AidB-like acyl-CoA dehydrogenase
MSSKSSSLLDTDLEEVLGGLESFLVAEVMARHSAHSDVLEQPTGTYLPSGQFSPAAHQLITEVRQASAAAGYYTMFVPEELGGAGLDNTAMFSAWEFVFRRCGERNWLGQYALAHWTKGPSFLLSAVAQRLREEALPALMSGKSSMCFAMSEPDAGSDIWSMRSKAVPVAGGWLLNGVKQWISNGAFADYAVVFAVTDPELARRHRGGISAFFLPSDTPGFSVDSVIPMFGQIGSNEAIVRFDEVRLPADALMGTLNEGMALGFAGVSQGRLFNAARAVGLARWAIESALDYAKQRVVFGHPIMDYQGISFALADAATETHAAHLMALNCARMLDAGLPARKELAMTKAFATEAGARAVDRAMQVHGAMGFTNELGLAQAWQHLRRAHIADGSAEVMRRQIAQRLFQGDTEL